MKKIIVFLLLPLLGFAQLKSILDKGKAQIESSINTSAPVDIAGGLREALNKGVSDQVSKLTASDGFFKNENVKILFPEELLKVATSLRKMGLGKLVDDGILSLNRAAESAVKEATPTFVAAIKNITITNAKSILLGPESAATTYLNKATNKDLYEKFSPIIQESIGKVGATIIWASIIKKYNDIPFISKVTPDLTDYVTKKALEGVFKMISIEEKNIRNNLNSRTSRLLQQVFAMQDKK